MQPSSCGPNILVGIFCNAQWDKKRSAILKLHKMWSRKDPDKAKKGPTNSGRTKFLTHFIQTDSWREGIQSGKGRVAPMHTTSELVGEAKKE